MPCKDKVNVHPGLQYTVLQFQDIKSEPFQMTIRLKQGCVMSPILFAIYIAELGHRLQKSDLGVSLDNIKIPGMFLQMI